MASGSASFRGRKHVTGLRPAGTKGRSFRGTTRFQRHPSLRSFADGLRWRFAADADRCCPDNAGALRRSLSRGRAPSCATSVRSGAPGSIRPRSVPARTDRRVSENGGSRTTSPDHSLVFDWLRSLPLRAQMVNRRPPVARLQDCRLVEQVRRFWSLQRALGDDFADHSAKLIFWRDDRSRKRAISTKLRK